MPIASPLPLRGAIVSKSMRPSRSLLVQFQMVDTALRTANARASSKRTAVTAPIQAPPPRTQSCCVAYPQGTTPGAYSMSFCWNPSSCNSLGQVKCIEEIDLEVPDEPVPMSAELPLDAINFIQNLDGACADVTTPEECKAILENDMTTSSGYGRGTAVAFGAALLAGVSLLN